MKSAQSPHSGRRAGQAPDVTGISTLVIVLLLALAHLARIAHTVGAPPDTVAKV